MSKNILADGAPSMQADIPSQHVSCGLKYLTQLSPEFGLSGGNIVRSNQSISPYNCGKFAIEIRRRTRLYVSCGKVLKSSAKAGGMKADVSRCKRELMSKRACHCCRLQALWRLSTKLCRTVLEQLLEKRTRMRWARMDKNQCPESYWHLHKVYINWCS